MTLPFVDQPPTDQEVERIRLILSTYQDGSGMNDSGTRPGWRDFERAVAVALGGEALESKYIFDVILSKGTRVKFGLSCKMGNQLDRIERHGRAFMELSNSYKKFWDHLNSKGIMSHNIYENPASAGEALLELVQQWYLQESHEYGGTIDLNKSFYLVLAYNRDGWYQLLQFSLELPNSTALNWYFPSRLVQGKAQLGNLRADDENGLVFEWYGQSGGQLKYYPSVKTAIWQSKRFQLEPLPDRVKDGLIAKVRLYFPDLWEKANDKLY